MDENEQRKTTRWETIICGLLFVLYGLAAATTGTATLDSAQVAGLHVRVGGVLLVVVGSVLVCVGVRKK